jgi:hypothetical protein
MTIDISRVSVSIVTDGYASVLDLMENWPDTDPCKGQNAERQFGRWTRSSS